MSAWDKVRKRKVHIICYAPQKPDRLEGLCLKSCEIRKACSKEMIEKVFGDGSCCVLNIRPVGGYEIK